MMPAYNFQKQFVEMIRNGAKHHTVRRKRKRQTKPGEVLKLYTGMRTKNCELIKEVTCTAVVPVQVLRGTGIILDGKLLSEVETVLFASRDGFPDVYDFFDFFDRYPFEVLSKELEVIYWR